MTISWWLGREINTAAGRATITLVQSDDGKRLKGIATRGDGETMQVDFIYRAKKIGVC